MAKQIIDIAINESGDGGELQLVNDDLQTIEGLTNQVYLALFGGNIEENTTQDLPAQESREDFWGNEYTEDEFQFNSNFERAVNTVALNSNGLKTLTEAAKLDLKYLEKYADVDVEANLTGIKRVQLLVTLTQPGNLSLKLQYIWDGTKNELIEDIIL